VPLIREGVFQVRSLTTLCLVASLRVVAECIEDRVLASGKRLAEPLSSGGLHTTVGQKGQLGSVGGRVRNCAVG
jgi:hypothetical protein